MTDDEEVAITGMRYVFKIVKSVVAHLILCHRHKIKFELFNILLLYLPFGQNWAIVPDESGNYKNLESLCSRITKPRL